MELFKKTTTRNGIDVNYHIIERIQNIDLANRIALVHVRSYKDKKSLLKYPKPVDTDIMQLNLTDKDINKLNYIISGHLNKPGVKIYG